MRDARNKSHLGRPCGPVPRAPQCAAATHPLAPSGRLRFHSHRNGSTTLGLHRPTATRRGTRGTPPRRRGGAEFEFRLERLQASRRPLWRGSGIARWDVMSKGTASSSPISITMRQSDTLSLASRCWLGRPRIRAQELWAFAQCTFPCDVRDVTFHDSTG